LTGSFPLTIETPSAIALQVLNAVFYGLDMNELQTYRDRVNMVTVDDIQRVAQQYLHPDQLSIVLVGDASVFGKQLAGVGFDQVERIPVADLDLSSPDLRRHATPGAGRVEPTAYRQAAPAPSAPGPTSAPSDARELIAKAVQAKGGLSLLRSIRTVKVAMTTTVEESNGARTDLPSTTSIRYPGAYRIDAQTAAGPLVQVFNAGRYWVQDARGVREAPEMAEQIRASVERDTVPLLIALAAGKLSAKLVPGVSEAGRTMPALEVALPGATPLTLVFDPATALIVKARYRLASPPDGHVTVEETYSDYRDVHGLQVAFLTELRREGAPVVERRLRSYEFNVPLDSALFSKPS